MRKILSILTLLIFISCSDKEEQKEIIIPNNVISKETMVNIVMDLSLFESARGMNLLNKIDTIQNLNQSPDIPKYHQRIFDKYGVSREKYDSSFSYYSQNPDVLLKIYEEAVNQLSQAQEAVNR